MAFRGTPRYRGGRYCFSDPLGLSSRSYEFIVHSASHQKICILWLAVKCVRRESALKSRRHGDFSWILPILDAASEWLCRSPSSPRRAGKPASRSDPCCVILLLPPSFQPLRCCERVMLKSMGRALAGCFWGIDLLFNKLLGTSVSRRWCGVDPTAKPCWWQGSAPASPMPQSSSGEKSSPSIPLCRCTEHFLPAAAVRLFKFLKHCLTSAFLACNPDLISKGEHKGRRLMQRLLSPADGELRISHFPLLLLPKNWSGGQRELCPRGKALSGGPGDAGSAVLYLTRDDSLVLAVSFLSGEMWLSSFQCPRARALFLWVYFMGPCIILCDGFQSRLLPVGATVVQINNFWSFLSKRSPAGDRDCHLHFPLCPRAGFLEQMTPAATEEACTEVNLCIMEHTD